jgi:O-antigen/teichoic acid export membrane protein
VIGAVLSLGARAALSYFIPHPAHRLTFHGPYVREILRFGKWIMISSFVVYAATYLDRIYLGRIAALNVLGIYGLARTIAELPPVLASRLSYQIVFPVLAGATTRSEEFVKADLAAARWKFVLLASVAVATLMAWADWAIRILYDSRYHDAGWMLFVLLIGAWVSVLSSLNEAILLGFGKPAYISLANGARLAFLAVGLPLGYVFFGLAGAIAAVPTSEIFRYVFVAFGQQKIRFSFGGQDGVATVVGIITFFSLILLRHMVGLGVPWADMVFHGVDP